MASPLGGLVVSASHPTPGILNRSLQYFLNLPFFAAARLTCQFWLSLKAIRAFRGRVKGLTNVRAYPFRRQSLHCHHFHPISTETRPVPFLD